MSRVQNNRLLIGTPFEINFLDCAQVLDSQLKCGTEVCGERLDRGAGIGYEHGDIAVLTAIRKLSG